jgi:hypothetical protein
MEEAVLPLGVLLLFGHGFLQFLESEICLEMGHLLGNLSLDPLFHVAVFEWACSHDRGSPAKLMNRVWGRITPS